MSISSMLQMLHPISYVNTKYLFICMYKQMFLIYVILENVCQLLVHSKLG